MDAIQITCKIADKLGDSRYWSKKVAHLEWEDGEFSDEEYAKRAYAYKTKIMKDGYPSSFSVPVLDIVRMVLEIQQEEHNKSEYREEPMATEEYVERIRKLYYD
ncbi:hypothetical protein SEA_WEASELS2_44 [Rhodococcus phage Weasels2]|uniref:Uncharacterized protein n=1 Tax=Rhodococcus phage Weasels2 TaxID=1897437 RepID=A0A1I9SA28_9CAUD|nr:hypothetical protein FDH04_gp044 [Rhodococcus phage Weasels2]AOZ63634.1 hypothetical protein SEA_WEASELS2_44 [Rhodococcus phage Weasels2]